MELSGGKFGINQYPGAQLGQEPVMLQKVRSGDIDFIISSSANASTVAPESGVMSLRYLFRDENHLRKSIADPGVIAAIEDMIAASVQGAHMLCVETLGPDARQRPRRRRLAQQRNVGLVGGTGTGKIHLAIYIGIKQSSFRWRLLSSAWTQWCICAA